jgi:hypothetical protein
MTGGDGDAVEALHAGGVTDGLPAVPPTRPRAARAVAAAGRRADELIAEEPPGSGTLIPKSSPAGPSRTRPPA